MDNNETEGRNPEDGRFLPGNRFWEARSSHGRKPKFSDPEDLWQACCEYFQWVEDNPLYEAKPFSYEGRITVANVPLMRAMTISGLCIFLDIEHRSWRNWHTERPDLLHVLIRVEEIIRTQKFEGASANLLNANIIARDLGLADKKELTGADGGPIAVRDTTEESLLEEAKRLGIDPASLGLSGG